MHKLIYRNFDGLDVTFQGCVPESVLDTLEEARTRAQEERREVAVWIGPGQIPALVAETGIRGGYRYRFTIGPDGETWFIARSKRCDGWNIRVSSSSLGLALEGYSGMKAKILARLDALGAIGSGSENRLMERVSRFDYAFDFIMDEGFSPLAEHFIAHRRCVRECWSRQGALEPVAIEAPVERYSATLGDTIATIRIGRMPGRQATLYNKSLETRAHDKAYWWDLWALDERAYRGRVWRVEVRAGKDELDKWQVKRFADLEAKSGNIVGDILAAIRYTVPRLGDSNRSRWPMAGFWRDALAETRQTLAEHCNNADRNAILTGMRHELITVRRNQITGCLIGLLAAQGRPLTDISVLITEIESDMRGAIRDDPKIFARRYRRAAERFLFLDPGVCTGSRTQPKVTAQNPA